jgi:triosephosphate isomerase
MRQLFVAGNWKMNLDLKTSVDLATALRHQTAEISNVTMAVAPVSVYLKSVCDALSGSSIGVAGQNMHFEESGAFTGEVAGPMLLDIGCDLVILGHSERRHVFGETDEMINQKLHKALELGLKPILCVGETLEQRKDGRTEIVNAGQLKAGLDSVTEEQMARVTIAYEPVWAIGTGETASPEQAEEVHQVLRGLLEDMFNQNVAMSTIIQYGGSVKPHNAEELMSMPNVDGALVGGASLKAETFVPIIETASKIKK